MVPKNTQSLILNILLLILTTHSLISRLIILNLKLKFKLIYGFKKKKIKLIYQITHVYGPWAMRYKIGLNSTQLVAPSNLNPTHPLLPNYYQLPQPCNGRWKTL